MRPAGRADAEGGLVKIQDRPYCRPPPDPDTVFISKREEAMDNASNTRRRRNAGLKKLVEKCRFEFRQPENTRHYSENDLREAERKFVRFCVKGN